MGSHKGFRQAVIPSELAKEVVQVIQRHPELGFRTLSEFVRSATAEKLRLAHLQLAMRALWETSELGADAMDALVRDSLPPEFETYLRGGEAGRIARRRAGHSTGPSGEGGT